MPTYLDDNGNPLGTTQPISPAKVYLDDSGNPIATEATAASMQSPSQPASATIGAAPERTPVQYIQDVQRDLQTGGNRTLIGKGLGFLQGRASNGYSGLESGTTPDVAQFMGSVPLGITKMALGGAESDAGNQWQGTKDVLSGALQTATIPSSFASPEAGELTAGGMGRAEDAATALVNKANPAAIKEAAGGLLQSVAHDANKVPVQLSNAGDAALKLMDWQKVTQLGPTLNKFLNRITNPKLGPLTYEEGRDFYQVLGNMSAEDKMRLPPAIKRDVTNMLVGLKQDIGNAADQVGKAADYYQGMGDYAKGAKLQQWYDTAKDFALKVAAPAAGLGAGATLWNYIQKGSGN